MIVENALLIIIQNIFVIYYIMFSVQCYNVIFENKFDKKKNIINIIIHCIMK